MRDQPLPLRVFRHAREREEIHLAVRVEHEIEACPLEAAACTVDGAQSGDGVEMNFIGTDANDRAVLVV
jgi:hypothetical protein